MNKADTAGQSTPSRGLLERRELVEADRQAAAARHAQDFAEMLELLQTAVTHDHLPQWQMRRRAIVARLTRS